MSRINAIRGMNDLLPVQSARWQYLESVVKGVLARYGYREIRMPIVESTELFKRSIGEVTDIVEKEMYTFEDRNGDSLTLRPEGTASCVRAGLEHGLLFNQTQKLWYAGPMFRHERPQKGRYRQFHQIGVECFGYEGADMDAELIIMTARFWKELGLLDSVKLELNTLGLPEERAAFKQALLDYLTPRSSELDEDSQRRLGSNPLRILDSKDAATQAILNGAPRLQDYLGEASQQHFATLLRWLDLAGIAYEINPKLVRGLDYYCHTVFEWTTTTLGAQGTVCAGGRYDGLVEQLGGKPCPGVGFAMGVERLVLMLETLNSFAPEIDRCVDVYVVAVGVGTEEKAFALSERLRNETSLRIAQNMGGGNFKNQMKRADKSGALIALILGESEVQAQQVIIKPLVSGEAQFSVPEQNVTAALQRVLG